MLTVGQSFPQFDLSAVVPGDVSGEPKDIFTRITERSDQGKWRIVFFWPKDFTFVCPTEIAAFGRLNGEFEDR
ncbi:MAG TPA: redoxin domain-containing protein, partial [Kiloniellales bacterium]|nr:redoxin domain-containing protein [Kiloniellales bacterium]